MTTNCKHRAKLQLEHDRLRIVTSVVHTHVKSMKDMEIVKESVNK